LLTRHSSQSRPLTSRLQKQLPVSASQELPPDSVPSWLHAHAADTHATHTTHNTHNEVTKSVVYQHGAFSQLQSQELNCINLHYHRAQMKVSLHSIGESKEWIVIYILHIGILMDDMHG